MRTDKMCGAHSLNEHLSPLDKSRLSKSFEYLRRSDCGGAMICIKNLARPCRARTQEATVLELACAARPIHPWSYPSHYLNIEMRSTA